MTESRTRTAHEPHQVRRLLLLGASLDTDNLGVSALATGAIRVLRRRYPAATIAFLDYGTRAKTHTVEVDGAIVEVPLINLRFSRNVLLPNHVAYLLILATLARIFGAPGKRFMTERNKWLRSICRADIAFAISGGDSFSDIYGLRRFFYVTLPQLLVTVLGTELCLLPQSIGPFRSLLSKNVSKFVMRRASVIYSRERAGVAATRVLLGLPSSDRKIRFAHDLAFALEPRPPAHIDLGNTGNAHLSSAALVGVNVSGLLLIGGYDRRNMFRLAVNYEDLVHKIIDFLIGVRNVNVLLVPHVFGEQDESDLWATAKIYGTLAPRYPGRLFAVQGRYDSSEIKHVIGSCHFFVASRMHACIAAISQGTPTVALAYSDKFVGILQGLGLESLVVDPRSMDLGTSLAIVASTYDNRARIRGHLTQIMPGIEDDVLRFLAPATS